jgi:hypothetical protein
MTYALLIYTSAADDSGLSEAEEQRALAAHRALQDEASADLRAVARLDDLPTARTVRFRDGEAVVMDGPYMETKEWLVGFYLVDCENEAKALERAQQICPHASHAIEIRPVTWTWDG